MADLTRIQFKRSKTPNVRPAPDTVAEGEIILNLADRAILTKLGNEIIDLGFAKGGKVDGNINLTGNFDQKNGNIVTTGSITANQESTINAPFNINDNIKIKDPNKPANFAALAYTTGKLYYEQFVDGKWTGQFIIPQGAGTAATQQWVNAMLYTSDTSTIMKNPNSNPRLCLITKDTGEAGAYDFANSRWAFVHNQAGFEVFGVGAFKSSNDYASIILKKSDNRFVQIETTPHAGSTTMLNFIYRQTDGTNQHVMQLPYETGTIASREWTNTMIKDLGTGVSMASPRGTTEIANNDDGNMGFWDKTTKRWVFVANPNTGANFSVQYVRIKNTIQGGDQSSFEATSPDGGKKIGLWAYNDGRTLLSAYAGGAWSNITIGGVGNGVIALREWVNTNYHSNLSINNTSSSWISMRDQPCFRSGNPVVTASASCILRQEHADRHFMLGGLGNTQFGIYMLNKNQTTNGTNGAAYLEDNGTWRCHGNGSFNDVEIRSDIRKKSELVAIDSALTKLKTLTGYTYLVEDENKTKHKSAGLIAQDVQKVLPEVINEDSNRFLTMTYNGIHALVVEAIKELSDRVEQLEVKYGN